MKQIPLFFFRCMLVLTGFPAFAAPEQKPSGQVLADVWRLELPDKGAPKTVFEQWRAQRPPADSQTLALEELSIPKRETGTMVRVTGMLTAPVSGEYAFLVTAPTLNKQDTPDPTELWIYDGKSSEWKLAQCAGNPNKRSGRTYLEAGVPRRFELWSMGHNPTVIEWEVVDTSVMDSTTGKPTVKLARQTIPASAMSLRVPEKDDADADGLLDAWETRYALQLNDSTGPNGPWGDPDGDNLPNWREQSAGTDPNKADTEGCAGLVRWEIWRDIPGRYVFDLRRAGHFPTGPRELRYLDRLEIPSGNGDRYGSRLRGLLKAPADGEYTFHLIADDCAELWLSDSDSWQNKRRIAQSNQPPGSSSVALTRGDGNGRTVPLRAEQIARVQLRAGQQYYIEVLHKQDSAQDHCSVAWTLPGAAKPARIDARHLVSWKPCPTDVQDDGLPDDWQRSAGLFNANANPATCHAEADSDGDGVCNRDEWLARTDPLNSASLPAKNGMLTSQAWTGIPGHSVSSLTGHDRYPAKPDVTTHIDNLDFGREGDQYGVRLRGLITAPDDGNYHFSIAGNNACTLYLAASEDKFTKRPISRVEVATHWRTFPITTPQKNGPFKLEKGQRYYIEVIFKRDENDNNKEDHSSVAWIRPGEQKFSVISPEFFSPYQADPRDQDDDDLPDAWEKLHNFDPTIPGGKHGAWGDPDRDGLENFREYQLGLDPNKVDVHGTPGLALWEIWHNRSGLISAHREQGGLSRVLPQDPRFPLEPARREWRDTLESPRRQGNDFAARLRAQILAPTTGDYQFSIAVRDVGELFLSTDGSKFNRRRIALIDHGTALHSWNQRLGQISKPIRLEAGKSYYLEALGARGPFHYEDDFLSIAWKPPGAADFQLIRAENLVAFFRDPNDQDDDDLPDDWEKRYRLNPADPHGNQGPLGDPDRDGMTNMEEYRSGSDPLNGDTDGDGVSDHDEIHLYGSNPLVKDVHPPVTHHRFHLINGTLQGGGTWVLDNEGALISGYRRGTLVFEFEVETPGIYALALEASSVGTLSYIPAVPVSVSVNQTVLGHTEFPASAVTRKWLTPWLPAGKHTVRVENRNVRANINLRILSLSLARFEDGHPRTGIPDWLSKLIGSHNEVLTSVNGSKVSPWFVEGKTRFSKSVSINSGNVAIPVQDHLAGRWHANVPLPEDGSSVGIAFDFENGAATDKQKVRWEITNLTQAPPVNHLRVGDSIRVIARHDTEDVFTLKMGERLWEKQATSDPITLRFDKPGVHVLTATLEGEKKITSTYHVHGADFGAPLTLIAGNSRAWTPADIRHPLEVQADKSIQLTPLEEHAKNGSPLAFRVRLDSTAASGPLAMIARLPGEGPIVAQGRVDALRLSSASKTGDAHVIGTLPDGTRVVQVSYIMDGPIPADLSIWIRLYVTDAVFTNGLTWLQLTAADFDENGVARFNVLKAPGTGTPYVCHWILPYADFEDVLNLRPTE